jgi:hypothetical protein
MNIQFVFYCRHKFITFKHIKQTLTAKTLITFRVTDCNSFRIVILFSEIRKRKPCTSVKTFPSATSQPSLSPVYLQFYAIFALPFPVSGNYRLLADLLRVDQE